MGLMGIRASDAGGALLLLFCLTSGAGIAEPSPPGFGDMNAGPVSFAERERRIFEREHPYRDDVFVVGEHLVFSVRYGVIRAGEATMSIRAVASVDSVPCFHIRTTAESNSFFSTFYHVRDRVETYVDTTRYLPRRFEKHLREGNYSADTVVEMDQRSLLAIYDNDRIFEMRPNSHDILSAFYEVRARRIVEPGESFDLETHVDRKNFPLKVVVHRRERIKVPAGEFDCLLVEPIMRSPGLFKSRGKLLIWMTDDRRRIPVQMRSELPIGAISVVLTAIEGREAHDRD